MGARGKTKAIVDWLLTNPDMAGYIKLNATTLVNGEYSINTVYNERVIRTYIDGTEDRQFGFSLVLVADWSHGFDDENQRAMDFGESWLDWVDAQYKAGNLPDFGESCEVTGIQALQNQPGLAAVYQEEQLARYTFSAQVLYRDRTSAR